MRFQDFQNKDFANEEDKDKDHVSQSKNKFFVSQSKGENNTKNHSLPSCCEEVEKEVPSNKGIKREAGTPSLLVGHCEYPFFHKVLVKSSIPKSNQNTFGYLEQFVSFIT